MKKPLMIIERTSALLDTPSNPDDYIILKIVPDGGGCCCLDCWPEAWLAVNRYIAPASPIEHEGSILLGNKDFRFVLESHESGPEIVIYLGFATASILLVKAVVELISTILKNVIRDRKCPSRIKIVKRIVIKGKFEEEVALELELPLSGEMEKKLGLQVRKILTKRQPRKSSVKRGANIR